ncbi:hypothetical protein ACEYW6_13910 [Nostoc sp. UIC 10607]
MVSRSHHWLAGGFWSRCDRNVFNIKDSLTEFKGGFIHFKDSF